jgi:hypothetical protein
MIFKMLRKIRPFLFFLILASSLTVIYIKTSKAATPDEVITCSAPGGCSGISGALFNETNVYPTQTVTKLLKAVNNYPEARVFAVEVQKATFSDSDPSLADVLKITITEINSGTVVYGPKSINEWLGSDYLLLTNIPSGGDRTYELKVDMDNVGNNYQSKTLVFDLNLGFEAVEETQTATAGAPFNFGGPPPPPNVSPAVLGLATKHLGKYLGISAEGGSTATVPEVKGTSCSDNNYLWWLPLIIEIVLMLGYFVWLKRRRVTSLRWVIIPLMLTAVSQYLHEVWKCNCATNKWCPKYIFLNLVILIAFFVADHLRKRSKKS